MNDEPEIVFTKIEPQPEDSAFTITMFEQNPQEIIRIQYDGRLFWKGREVETDEDFRAAMMDLAKSQLELSK